MKTFIADAPNGEQMIFTVEDSGGYFEQERVVWDTAVDGPLPDNVVVGGMVRQGSNVTFSQARMNQHNEAQVARLVSATPTKEQLLAQLNALQAQIQALA